jgi:hypothetical protein
VLLWKTSPYCGQDAAEEGLEETDANDAWNEEDKE